MISWQNWSDCSWMKEALWDGRTEGKLFCLAFLNNLRNHIQWLICKDIFSNSTSTWDFPPDILKANLAVGNFLLSSTVINESCNMNLISRSNKVFITCHWNFDHTIIGTASTTLGICNLLFLNHTWKLSTRF